MGLDAVEIVLRAEDFFGITIADDEAAMIRTAGDYYESICTKLKVLPLQSPVTPATLPTISEKEKRPLFIYKYTPLPAPPEVLPRSSQSIWDSLVAVLADQRWLKPEEILYHARFAEDLGVD